MWLCYGVHITVCMTPLAYVLCQPVHSCIEPSLDQLDFFLEIFLWRLVSRAAYALAVDASSSHVCIDEWLLTASTLCPLSLPTKTTSSKSQLHAQSKAQMNHPQIISWLLVAVSNATRITLWH